MTSGVSEALAWKLATRQTIQSYRWLYGIADFIEDLKEKGYIREGKRLMDSKLQVLS